MKLNKKGFGVAEIAIVVLLIGILAAAVIAGFMGIKKNANDVADEQKEIAQTMSNDLKHAFPTILSRDLTTGLSIGAGEYEVYELGGYNIIGKGKGYNAVTNRGTLFISGNGTLDKTCQINGGQGYCFSNYGTLTMSDIVLTGGNYQKIYPIYCGKNSITYLENVVCEGDRSVMQVEPGAKAFISGVNTDLSMTAKYQTSTTGRNIFVIRGEWVNDPKDTDPTDGMNKIDVKGEVTISDGTFALYNNKNTYVWLSGGKLTIKNGTFKQYETANNNFIFAMWDGNTSDGILNIEDGFFDCNATGCFVQFNSPGTVTILGGEFINTPNAVKGGTGTIIITGGAFQWDPRPYLPETHTAVQKMHTCKDGEERLLWVVSEK